MRKVYHVDKTDKDWKNKWLKFRKTGVGGSDVAPVCELSPWQGAFSVWYDKRTPEIILEKENIAMELGLELEPFLSRHFKKLYLKYFNQEIEMLEMPYILADDKIDYFLVSLDRYFIEEDEFIPVELKTSSEFLKDDWGDPKDPSLPIYYYYQVQWQIMITNARRAYVGFLIGNRKFDLIEVKRDDEVIKKLRTRVKDFWENYVLTGIAPAADGSTSSKETLALMHPKEVERILIPSDEEYKKLDKLIGVYDENNETKKTVENALEKAKQEMAQILGDYERADVGGRAITYKTVRREVSAYTSISRYVRIY